jgi:hypothetical protein
LAPDVRLAHPFLRAPVVGAGAVRQSLRVASEALDQEVVSSLEFQSDSAAAVLWKSGPQGREIQGVTLALMNANGLINELRIALRPVQHLARWREMLRAGSPLESGWDIPPTSQRAVTAGSVEPVDARLPLPLSDHAVFHGPVFVRGVEGADAVTHVVGHARAVYGECEYGPVLRNGAYVLRALTSKLPLEILSIAHVDDNGCVDEWSAFMQPWPGMMLVLEQLRARLDGYLDTSFFEVSSNPANMETLNGNCIMPLREK